MKNERKKKQPRTPAQDVYYTPPVPLNRKKLVLRLLTVAAVVVALFLGFAIFFRVENVVVSGTEKYTPWAVCEASGIRKGESLLGLSKAKAAGNITQELRYIKGVRIGITLPDTVNIYVEELDVVYALTDAQGNWWLMAADGKVVEQATREEAQQHTLIHGVTLDRPTVGKAATAHEQGSTDPDAPVQITAAQRLQAALTIVKELEANGVLGEADTLDVTDVMAMELWYGDDYQVLLGEAKRMDEKIAMMCAVINQHRQEGGYQSGILDITLTTEPDGVGYTPF